MYTNNELDDIVNKCNNRYHIAIKMKSFDIETGTYVDFDIEKMMQILNLKLMTI